MTIPLCRNLLLCLCLVASSANQAFAALAASAAQSTVTEAAVSHSGCHDSETAYAGCPHGGGDVCLCAIGAAVITSAATSDSAPLTGTAEIRPPITRQLPAHGRAPLRPPC